MNAPARHDGLPAIALSSEDHRALERLIGDQPSTGPAALLQQELDRAEILDPAEMPPDVVTLNRWLHYTDGRGQIVRRIQLVMPADADIDEGRVSILSHVGAGLIGLKEGQSIDWPDPSGGARTLTPVLIEDLTPQDLAAVGRRREPPPVQ